MTTHKNVAISMLLMVSVVVTGGCAATGMTGLATPAPSKERIDEYAKKIDELMPGMGAAQLVDRKDSQLAFEKICFDASGPGKETERAAMCAAIMTRVGPGVAKPARVWLLRKVEPIGRDEVVPGLATLFKDPDPQIRELARRALQNNPSPKAAAALRAELAQCKDDTWRIALVNAIGFRRDPECVTAFGKLAKGDHDAVATAAISALGDIGNDAAVKVLTGLLKTAPPNRTRSVAQASRLPSGVSETGILPVQSVIDACLRAAEHLIVTGHADRAAAIYEQLLDGSQPEAVRIAAMQGLTAAQGPKAMPRLLQFINGQDERLQLTAARCAQGIRGREVTLQLTDALKTASPQVQVLLLDVLGRRACPAARPAVTAEADSREAEIRIAALAALRSVGDASTVQLLAQRAAKATGPERDTARDSLNNMPGAGVDEAIVHACEGPQSPVRAESLKAAIVRRIPAAVPKFLVAAGDGDPAVRIEVLSALGLLANEKDLPPMIDLCLKATDDVTRKAAEEAITAVALRVADATQRVRPVIAALAHANAAGKASLIRVLGKLAQPETLEPLLPYLDDSDVKGEAAAAVVGLAIRIGGRERDKAMAVLQRARAATANDAVRQQVDNALDAMNRYCLTWLFSGVYKKKGMGNTQLFDEPFPPEKRKGNANWLPLAVTNPEQPGKFDLGKDTDCCGYVRTSVWSPSDQDAQLALGSNDGIKVWLNGDVVHAKNVSRGLKCDEDVVNVKLKQGWNPLLLKITQGPGDWMFCCAIRSPEGKPLEGLKFEAK